MSSSKGFRDEHEYTFRSPGTGAYRVQVVGSDDVANTASMLLAGHDDEETLPLRPGQYTALIEPIGSSVKLRQEFHLDADGNRVVQLKDEFQAPSEEVPAPPSVDLTPEPRFTAKQERVRSLSNDFSVGLSCRTRKSSKWIAGSMDTSVADAPGGGAALVLRPPTGWEAKPEWRLTVACGDLPPWRVMVPLFKDGVQVVLLPSREAAGAGVQLQLAPRDPARAALIGSLEKMTVGTASDAVKSSLHDVRFHSHGSILDNLIEAHEDPWTITAAALLLARSNELDSSGASLELLRKQAPYISDLRVLSTWLRVRGNDDSKIARMAVTRLSSIKDRPYFASSVQLALDLLASVGTSVFESLREPALKERTRWVRLYHRGQGTGEFVSWTDSGLSTSSALSSRTYSVVATGHVTDSKLSLKRTNTPRLNKRIEPPALKRPLVARDDQWKGRFGKRRKRDGYEISASFARGADKWIQISVCVTVPEDRRNESEPVYLYLHETFHPDRIRLTTKDGKANDVLLAWGGFTIGAWLPSSGVELELDLSKVRDAPRAIRED